MPLEITPEIQAIIDEQTKGLKEKNTELLGKLKEKQTYAEQLAEAKEKAELDALERAGNVDALKKQIEDKYGKVVADKEAAIKDLNGKLHKLVIEDGLTAALAKAGVAPQFIDAAKALLKNSTQFEIADDLTAKVGESALSDYVAKWATGEAGKHFIAAPHNAGGGSKGSNGAGKAITGKTVLRADFDQMTQADRTSFIRDGGTVTD